MSVASNFQTNPGPVEEPVRGKAKAEVWGKVRVKAEARVAARMVIANVRRASPVFARQLVFAVAQGHEFLRSREFDAPTVDCPFLSGARV